MFYVVASKKADLGYLVNLNTITFHSAFSTIDKIDCPDLLIWDLDPSDSDFNKVIDVAFKIKEFADNHHIKLLLKTTGSKGLHIYAPLNKQLRFDEVHLFSKIIANQLAAQFPKQITTAQQKVNRQGRVLIDYVRNSYGQTAVSPYSLRALPNAPIATPIQWEELGATVLSSQQFNLSNIFERIKKEGDIWNKAKVSNPNIHSLVQQLNKEFKKTIS
jgi:bifunctional non-homologous end joining protein LigD